MELLNTLTASRGRVLFPTRFLDALCDPADSVGNCVYISGNPISGVEQVRTVDITDPAKMPAVGVIQSKSSPTECRVIWMGEITQTGLTFNKFVFVSASSTLTTTPATPTVPITHQVMGIATASNKAILSPNFPAVRRKP